MEESCENCKFCLKLEICDYSQGGCKHTRVDDDWICLAFMDEGLACLMRGCRKSGMCEMWTRKEEKKIVGKQG